jgi:hypothetical protein
MNFVIILREITPDLLLITSFSVDKEERYSFKKKYKEYKEKT